MGWSRSVEGELDHFLLLCTPSSALPPLPLAVQGVEGWHITKSGGDSLCCVTSECQMQGWVGRVLVALRAP